MRSTGGLQWDYFNSNQALLLDKIYKFEDKTFELGGKASEDIFGDRNTVAVHTTCYEQKSKVMGLKVRTVRAYVSTLVQHNTTEHIITKQLSTEVNLTTNHTPEHHNITKHNITLHKNIINATQYNTHHTTHRLLTHSGIQSTTIRTEEPSQRNFFSTIG